MMAASKFTIRCKTENGAYTIENISSEHTVKELKALLQEVTKMSKESMKLLCGYPPKALHAESDYLKLKEVNIKSGDTIIIEYKKPTDVVHGDVLKPKEDVASYDIINLKKYEAPLCTPLTGIMMRHVVPSNNSCLFTSVNFILREGNDDVAFSNELRKVIAEEVSKNPVKYNSAFLGMPNAEYCTWICNSDHWGGAIELAILSERYSVEIVAVDTVSLKMHRFGEDNNYNNRIFLIYDGIHYDPLIFEMSTSQQGIFSASDDVPMELALEVAREARSSRQFTDVANFTLCCSACNERLRGDKEAREHARTTGHCEFGEINQ